MFSNFWNYVYINWASIYDVGNGLECYFCGYDGNECNAADYGDPFHCQMDDAEKEHYGNVCYVAHTGNFLPRVLISEWLWYLVKIIFVKLIFI